MTPQETLKTLKTELADLQSMMQHSRDTETDNFLDSCIRNTEQKIEFWEFKIEDWNSDHDV